MTDLVEQEVECTGQGFDGTGCKAWTTVAFPKRIRASKNPNTKPREFLCGFCVAIKINEQEKIQNENRTALVKHGKKEEENKKAIESIKEDLETMKTKKKEEEKRGKMHNRVYVRSKNSIVLHGIEVGRSKNKFENYRRDLEIVKTLLKEVNIPEQSIDNIIRTVKGNKPIILNLNNCVDKNTLIEASYQEKGIKINFEEEEIEIIAKPNRTKEERARRKMIYETKKKAEEEDGGSSDDGSVEHPQKK